MSTKDNKELVRQYLKDFGEAGDDVAKMRAVFDKYCASGYIYHNPGYGDLNKDQVVKTFAPFMSAFPDGKLTIDDMIAESDKVVTRTTVQATHKATFMGIPATGKKVSMKGMLISKIVRGKVVEEWELIDGMGLMTQLGAIPAPKK